MTDALRTTTAVLLERLADRQGAGPVTAEDLGPLAGLAADEASVAVPMVLALAGVFGVLREESTPDGTRATTVISPQAAYFLRSLAAHVRSGHTILDNWERAGTDTEPFTAGQVLAGPQFLHLAETHRLTVDPGAQPLREVDVVQVLVKSRARRRGSRARYLLQYDVRARQYQLAGGHARGSDADPRATAVRELEEELDGYAHRPDRDVLTELGVVEAVQPSRTHGALSRYRMTFFLLKTEMEQLRPGPGARWVDEADLLDGDFRIGRASLNVTALSRLESTLPGGLRGLPWSFPDPPRRGLAEVISDRPWEVAGLMIGVIGLALSLIPLLL
ncbi:NUDIX domain-containing protein [Streptomyces sp. LN325]|uniref:NUDIX domain-containing protein n=1 Tax=Streptomyces sp. LN325 TaxID=3112976 RepID=UPI003711EDB4